MKNLLFLLPALLAGGLAAVVKGVFQTVPRGHEGIKERKGEPVKVKALFFRWWPRKCFDYKNVGKIKIYPAGKAIFKIPFVDEVVTRRVNGQEIQLKQRVILKGSLVCEIRSYVICAVPDVEKFAYVNEHPKVALRLRLSRLILREFADIDFAQLDDFQLIEKSVKDKLEPFAASLGISVVEVGITDCDPTALSEQTMQISTQMRVIVESLKAEAVNMGFVDARDMGPAWAGVLASGSTVNAIPATATDASEVAGELEEELQALGGDDEAANNGHALASVLNIR